jgi:hypothetical protein
MVCLTMNNTIPTSKHVYTFRRDINGYSMGQFTFLLSFENWEDVFSETTVNIYRNSNDPTIKVHF